MGSIPELGEWKNFMCQMKWTEGHVWVAQNIGIRSEGKFQYKYVVKTEDDEENVHTIWEKGYDRIADLSLLPDLSPTKVTGRKTVELVDLWEKFDLKLTVLYPNNHNHATLSVEGNPPELGGGSGKGRI